MRQTTLVRPPNEDVGGRWWAGGVPRGNRVEPQVLFGVSTNSAPPGGPHDKTTFERLGVAFRLFPDGTRARRCS